MRTVRRSGRGRREGREGKREESRGVRNGKMHRHTYGYGDAEEQILHSIVL